MSALDRQIQREVELRTVSEDKGYNVLNNAVQEGRVADTGYGKRLIARAVPVVVEHLEATLSKSTRGMGGKFRSHLRKVDSTVLAVIGLRSVLSLLATTSDSKLRVVQHVIRTIGTAIESECMLTAINTAAAPYLKRTLEYLDNCNTTAVEHRRRTFLVAAERTIGGWDSWTSQEREGTARLLLDSLYSTGLFEWRSVGNGKGKDMYYLDPTIELRENLEEVLEHTRAIAVHEPMIVKPEPWTSFSAGGYLTPEMRVLTPAISIRTSESNPERFKWVVENFNNKAGAVMAAMNRAQEIPYRINTAVLAALNDALRIEAGVMGLPAHGEHGKPTFPFDEDWLKDSATPEQLVKFEEWKSAISAWWSMHNRKEAAKRNIALQARMMQKYAEEAELYFVTYVDYRGRVYFRGAVNPQGSDSVKGCLEFANAQPLGKDGLFWLKAHVAACAGFDKHDFSIRVQWTDDNWEGLLNWAADPLNVPSPSPDTSFTLLAAVLDLKAALATHNPELYESRIPVAMDATCSGLQHFSALFRDPIGAKYTNLVYSGEDQKQDIYKHVASAATAAFKTDDLTIAQFWSDNPVTRNMAKGPVMTYVYGATQLSNTDYIIDKLAGAGFNGINDTDGTLLYSLGKLSSPMAAALRAGVESTVPAAAEGMRFLQETASCSASPVRWFSPVGMPVYNWSEVVEMTKLDIRSMGIAVVLMRRHTGEYDRTKAKAAIAPNFVHCLDSAHLCMVLNDTEFDIMPIHDSFACHASNVPAMHKSIRSMFCEMYRTDWLAQLADTEVRKGKTLPERPLQGTFNIREVLNAKFMFC